MINEVKEKIEDLYDYVWATGYDCEDCEYKKLVHEPHGEVTRHCSMENYPLECPVVENAIQETSLGGTK
tara:strand:+ start:433 stop:639 length:207 start_codon:yes stop_codon:yes gene_type:complete